MLHGEVLARGNTVMEIRRFNGLMGFSGMEGRLSPYPITCEMRLVATSLDNNSRRAELARSVDNSQLP